MGLKGRRFQWLDWSMPYGVLDELNAKSGVVDDCTREQILEVIEGMFTFGIHRISDEDFNERIGVTGMVIMSCFVLNFFNVRCVLYHGKKRKHFYA